MRYVNGIVLAVSLVCALNPAGVYGAGLKCLAIAKGAKTEALHYKALFKDAVKASLGLENPQGDFSITNNSDNGVSIVYAGVSQHLLRVEVNRAVGTNELFRFSRQDGGITQYEAYDAKRNGIMMSFHTNGNLRLYAMMNNAAYCGIEYHFDEEGRITREEDITGKPVFIVPPPINADATPSIHVHDELTNAVRQL